VDRAAYLIKTIYKVSPGGELERISHTYEEELRAEAALV
jgi:hypothetical protein